MQQIRTFIAISLTPELKSELGKLMMDLKSQEKGVRWVNPASIHLTLKFLGELSLNALDKVFSGMDIAQAKFPGTFSLKVSEMGCFPSCKRPRVLWVGVKGEKMENLRILHTVIEDALHAEGFPREDRKFSPHLTVARIKFGNRLESFTEMFCNYPFPEKSLPVQEIHVMRSDLKPGGAVYTIQKTYKLKEVS